MPRDPRQHPRRGRHRLHAVPEPRPAEHDEGPDPDSEEAARLQLLAAADEAPPPLSKDRIARLEALTAVWMREVRVGGPDPDDTLLYAAPKPPPPPPRAPDPDPLLTDESTELTPELAQAVLAPAGPPRVVRDWSSRHDARSRDFDVAGKLKRRVPVQDRLWPIGPVFDQGTTPPLSLHDASGCVGMAVAAAANVFEFVSRGDRYEHPVQHSILTKEDALALYARAQELDHVSGEAYAGTSILAGMKAGQEAGLWPGYLWAFGTRDIAQALLQVGPVVIGIPWYAGMETPDPSGVVRPTGERAGGHALALVGILTSRPGGPWFVAQQSRGPAEGVGGLVYIHHKDLSRLLAGIGEAAIPIPPGGFS